jgi:ABC-type amino acid transport substrate-binding protein
MSTMVFLFRLFSAILCLVALLCGCSRERTVLRLGIDPTWFPFNFDGQQPFVNGFIEDLLQEVANYSGMRIERIEANWDSLLDGLREKRYDAVLTSIPPYNFNVAKYDFSKNVLDLGPVLIVQEGSKAAGLDELSHELVGIVASGDASLILQKHADVLMRSFSSIPAMLDSLTDGEIKGALLDRLLASSYVRDLYSGTLKVSGKPLSAKGLHLAVLKGQQKHALELFDKSLDHLQKKKKMQGLLVKWQLD